MTTTAFSPRGKYQNRGSGLRSRVHVQDQVREQALLLVRLRDRDLVEVDPVGLRAAEEQSSERIGAIAVALLAGPGRIALARVDDRARQVVGERRGLAAVRPDGAASPPDSASRGRASE